MNRQVSLKHAIAWGAGAAALVCALAIFGYNYYADHKMLREHDVMIKQIVSVINNAQRAK
jgi:hypothetical protein